MKPIRILLALSALVVAGILVAGCGGDDAGDEDPATVLQDALTADQSVSSGVLNLALTGSVEGEQSVSVDASLGGPFQGGDEGAAPEFDLDGEATVEAEGVPELPGGAVSFDVAAGLGLADDQLFVEYQGTTYAAGEELNGIASSLVEAFRAAGGAAEEADPAQVEEAVQSFSNLSNEGTEDLNGESVVHIAGDIDLAELIQAEAGTAAPLDLAQLEGVDISTDFYVGEDDDRIRQVEFGVAAAGIEQLAEEGFESMDFTFTAGISEPDSEQSISAPTDAEPLDDLLAQFGLSEADLAQAFSSGLVAPGAPGLPDLGGGNAEKLRKCLQQAGSDADAINECASEL